MVGGLFQSSSKRADNAKVARDSGGLNDASIQELQRKLMRVQGSSSASTGGSAGSSDLRYAKFRIGGVPGEKHAVFVPDSSTPTAPVLAQVCQALGREPPALLLCGASSASHPARLSTPELRACPGLRRTVAEARGSLGLEEAGPAGALLAALRPCCLQPEPASGEREAVENAVEEIANRALERNVAAAVRSVATAASRTNTWTLTGPRISSFEVLLQQCIESGETDIFRLVIGHVQDRAYMEAEPSRQLMRQLFEHSQVMSFEAVGQCQPISLSGDLWNPSKNMAHDEFALHGYDYWSFDTWDGAAVRGHPLAQWPWPHGDLFLLFYRQVAIAGAPVAEADWRHTTRARLDREAIPFAPEVLAPLGYCFVGAGGAQLKQQVLQGLKLQKPLVLLDNTPGAPKQLSLLLALLQQAWQAPQQLRPLLEEGQGMATGQDLLARLSPRRLLDEVQRGFDASGMDPEDRLGLQDVQLVLELARRRGPQLLETCCVLDPLAEQPPRMQQRLLPLFAGPGRDQGPPPQRQLVFAAWGLHRRLTREARHLALLWQSLLAGASFCLLLSAFLAATAVHLRLRRACGPLSEAEEVLASGVAACALGAALVVLPLSGAALLALQARLRPRQRWGLVHSAAAQVASEIYSFLGNVGPYLVDPAANQRRFTGRLRDVLEHLALLGVPEEELEARADDDLAEPGALQEHIDRQLYGEGPRWPRCLRRRRAWPWSPLLEGPEPQDPAAPLSAEAYLEARVAPLRRSYGAWLRTHAWRRRSLDVASLLLLGLASVLGASGLALWVPVALGGACLAQGLLPPEAPQAVSAALAALNDLDLLWQGSDIRANRSEATKRSMILATERHSLAVAMSCSQAAWFLGESSEWDGLAAQEREVEAVERAAAPDL